MYLGMVIVVLVDALRFAVVVFVPGLLALALALLTSKANHRYVNRRPYTAACLELIHGLSRRACIILLATAGGLAGAGLVSVCLNAALLAIAVVLDSVWPAPSAEIDMNLVGVLYFGVLSVGFLVFFAMATSRLVKWLKPKSER